MQKLIIKLEKECLFDEEDEKLVSAYTWYLNPAGYVIANGRDPKLVYMHRLVMNAKKGQQIDHINGNKADNRKCNLRFSDQSQNRANSKKQIPKGREATSQYKGVRMRKDMNPKNRVWTSAIKFRKKRFHLGSFHTELEAAQAYDKEAVKVFGEYAQLNFDN